MILTTRTAKRNDQTRQADDANVFGITGEKFLAFYSFENGFYVLFERSTTLVQRRKKQESSEPNITKKISATARLKH